MGVRAQAGPSTPRSIARTASEEYVKSREETWVRPPDSSRGAWTSLRLGNRRARILLRQSGKDGGEGAGPGGAQVAGHPDCSGLADGPTDSEREGEKSSTGERLEGKNTMKEPLCRVPKEAAEAWVELQAPRPTSPHTRFVPGGRGEDPALSLLKSNHRKESETLRPPPGGRITAGQGSSRRGTACFR